MPILKGRAGELRALHEMNDTAASRLVPLIEVPLMPDDDDSDEGQSAGAIADVGKFASDLKKWCSSDHRLIVDATAAPVLSDPTAYLINTLASADFDVTPTVRPSDPRSIFPSISEALRQWNIHSACIRLGGDDLDDSEIPLSDSIDQLLDQLSLDPSDVDMVLDLGTVQDDHAMSFATRIARLVLSELPHADEWRTLVCAAGAFPPDLNSVHPGVLTEIPRYDAAMWLSLKQRNRGRMPIFGDYGVAYPAQTAGAPFAPAPQLRFTAEDKWLVMKGRKQDRRGASQFFEICARVVESGLVDSTLSWGDDYIERASRSAAKTGNAMIWRAIGTSHHLAYVASRLAILDVP